MKLANVSTKTLLILATSLCVVCLVQLVWAQATTTPKPVRKTKPAAAAHATAPAKTAAPQTKAASGPTKATSASPAQAVAQNEESTTAKRDPFNPLITEHKDSAAAHLPPGKAGLVVSTVRVDGTVRNGDGMMIAVLSNPEEHVYFAREGDHLYDGDVEKISLDGVTFRESSKDAFGKPVERVVTKRIYASAGAQQ